MSRSPKSPNLLRFHSIEGDTKEQLEVSGMDELIIEPGKKIKNSQSTNYNRYGSFKMRESMRIPTAKQKMFVKRKQSGQVKYTADADNSRLVHYSSAGNMRHIKENVNMNGKVKHFMIFRGKCRW
jgi:hypothetical protein